MFVDVSCVVCLIRNFLWNFISLLYCTYFHRGVPQTKARFLNMTYKRGSGETSSAPAAARMVRGVSLGSLVVGRHSEATATAKEEWESFNTLKVAGRDTLVR